VAGADVAPDRGRPRSGQRSGADRRGGIAPSRPVGNPERIKGWYNLVGGGAGFLMVDYDDPKELTKFLQPYMDLMSFDVRAVTENSYKSTIEDLRRVGQGGQRANVTRNEP
jgi:hypothetical protein